MRFLWQSNAPWAGTGYGAQTGLLLKALQGLGADPQCFAFWGLQGNKISYDGYTVWPGSPYNDWGSDVIETHIMFSKAEMVITLMDLFVLREAIWMKLPVPWIAWVPIDGVDIGDPTLNLLKHVDYPVAMSRFGADQMSKKGISPAATIYHTVDTEVFKPFELEDRKKARKKFNLPQDSYVIGFVMANKGDRKQYPIQFEAIKRFMDQHLDVDVKVYLHTDPTDGMGGWEMRKVTEKTGLKGKAHGTNQYLATVVPFSAHEMAELYNCFDVLMNCSSGEGFGIPIVEAQACGVPVITHGVTAMGEITINGYAVKSEGYGLASNYGWQYSPSVDDMVYRLECVYRMASKQKSMEGRAWVQRHCSLPVIARQWMELINFVHTNERKKLAERRRWVE